MGGGGKAKAPQVPAPEPPPKPQTEVTNAFRQARSDAQRTSRGLTGTDITGGILADASNVLTGKKTLLGG